MPSLFCSIPAILLLQLTPDGKRLGSSSRSTVESGQSEGAMNTLKIERIGGLAGFGLPGSKVQSNQFRRFLTADQASVEALFQNPPLREEQQRDAFRYRITRTVKGNKQTVEVPESAVPARLAYPTS